MKITIDDNIISKYKLTNSQFFFMLFLHYGITDEELNSLINEKFLVSQSYRNGGIPQNNFYKTLEGNKLLDLILKQSSCNDAKVSGARIKELAIKLRNEFPEGKKNGTNFHWKCSSKEVEDKLKSFFVRFGDYSDEDLIQATKNYVVSHSNDNSRMRILKYFIIKKTDQGVSSDLLAYVENLDNNTDGYIDNTKLI